MAEGSLALLIASAVNYFWRGLGVAIAGSANPRHPVIVWAGYVTYAMLAGLFVRMIVLPDGELAGLALEVRLVACAVAVAVFYAARRNALVATLACATTLAAVGALVR